MAMKVEGELYKKLVGQLFEIGRQLNQKSGYPYDAHVLVRHLQDAVEGKMGEETLHSRTVTVDRMRSPHDALKATGRNLYAADSIICDMPRGDGDEVTVEFFKVGRCICDIDLEKEYEKRGLVPADPYSLAAVNKADPALADKHPNCTHWKDKSDKYCYITFDRWDGERCVRASRDTDCWSDEWWFAGVCKESLGT